MTEDNFLLKQYAATNPGSLPISHNYLRPQFDKIKGAIFRDLGELVENGDFTLGKAVGKFEEKICAMEGVKHCLGVGNGTEAIFLGLKAMGIKPGDEVITTPYTFYATTAAIVACGAKPVFADIQADYNINPAEIEKKITDKTKAILPVHWAGLPCDMPEIKKIARTHGLSVVQDACHAIKAEIDGKSVASFGDVACFSLHPLKNLNCWGDGGFMTVDSKEAYDKLSLLRNHGLVGRDTCETWGYNSRLDALQAIVANHLLGELDNITDSRINNAKRYDSLLKNVPEIKIPRRQDNVKQVYHLYVIRAEKRDDLQKHLISRGVDAKVHYPTPIHLQPAARDLGHKKGDFPICEAICDSVISLPVHEYITKNQQEFVADKIKGFYGRKANGERK